MAVRTVSSREFNQDTGKAKQAAKDGPVIITDRGRPAHVLMSFKEYQRLTGGTRSIVDMIAMDDPEDIAFEAPVLRELTRPADLD